MPAAARVLGLGNEILADDAFGILVAREIERVLPPETVEVVSSSAGGLRLLDCILNVSRLVVVDTIRTGRAAPGTLYVLRESDLAAPAGATPHCTGLLDALQLARHLGLPAPGDVTVIAVEPADCFTVGGAMHPAVAAAIPKAVALVLGAMRPPAVS